MALRSQRASTSTPLTVSWKNDVFLSFRGETRWTFSDHLYQALKDRQIRVFRDDGLVPGTIISQELMTAIEESRFAIIVISQDFANSTWCLEELVKIFECMVEKKSIMPIFYKVDPSDVRKQMGTFKEAFDKHQLNFADDMTKVKRWKDTFTKVANITGWSLEDRMSETEFIKKIVELLYNKLFCASCKVKVDDIGFSCMDEVWHRECFCCEACNLPITDQEFWKCEEHNYHEHCYKPSCYVCTRSIPENEDHQVEYMEHPFWRQKYCPSHESDVTLRCCSCERLKPKDTTYCKLHDGRQLCPDCKESEIINTDDGCQSIYLKVQNFYKGLKLEVQKIPVQLVSREEINEALEGENDDSDHHLPVIRTVCLLEERLVTNSCFRWTMQRHFEVKEIIIWYGLPRLLTGSLLAQQVMSAWLRIKHYPNLNLEVEKGMSRYMALRWLEEYSSNPDSSRQLSTFENKLCEFRKRKIESDCGDEFLKAKEAVSKYGLIWTLEIIRKTGNFPPVACGRPEDQSEIRMPGP